MHIAYHRVAPFAAVHGLIYQKVNLLRQPLAVTSEDSALAWRQKIQWSWLRSIAWVVNLLHKVKTVTHCEIPGVGSSRMELLQTPLMCYILGVGSHLSVELTFPFYMAEMSLLLKKENILLLHCQVGTLVDPGGVPLAPPAQVCHRSGQNNEGAQLTPQLAEGGLSNLSVAICGRMFSIQPINTAL